MPIFQHSYDAIAADILNEITEKTSITRMSAGGKARALIDAIARQTNDTISLFDRNFSRAFLSRATGKQVGFFGDLLGVPKLEQSLAHADSSAGVVQFSVVGEGTFGSINSGSNIVVTTGTIISPSIDSKLLFRVTENTTLTAGLTKSFISVEALTPGSLANIGTGTLNYHNFTGYSDALSNSLRVTNLAPILNGQDEETEANYKFRISKQVLASETANEIAIRLAALSVPGMADLRIFPFYQGIGTFDIVIKAVTPSVPDSLVSVVQAVVNSKTAEGNQGTVRKPRETGMSFQITLTYRESLSSDVKQEIHGKATDALREYVDVLDIGEDFIVNEGVQRVLEVDNRIRDMGSSSQPFDDISVWKSGKLEDNKTKQSLLNLSSKGNYSPKVDEKLLIEPISNPIVITDAN